MNFSRGMRDKLDKYVNINEQISVGVSVDGSAVYDFCCFGVDKNKKLSDEGYMIFYNQTSSPNGEIRFTSQNKGVSFDIELSKLPSSIDRLIFTASIDGSGTMKEINKHTFVLSQNNSPQITMELSGTDFKSEKAIISVEIYRKDGWRISAVANGFNGGLSALLALYGGTELKAEETSAPKVQNDKEQQSLPFYLQQSNSVQTPVPQTKHTQPAPTFNQPAPPPPPQYTQPAPTFNQPAPPPPPQYTQTAPTFNQPASPPPPQYTQPAPTFNQPASPPPPQYTQPAPVKNSGVSLKKTEEQITNEVMGKISLSKDKQKLQEHVVNLSKCVVDLSKNSKIDLGNMRAKVVVALDYSGSMSTLYSNGTVQNTINRLVPLGLTFDDNGTIDVFLFQDDYRKIDDLNLHNYENYVEEVIKRSGYSMGGTNYSPVLRSIIMGTTGYRGGFLGLGATPYYIDAPIVDNGDPTFILFITDGENFDRRETDDIIRRSSSMNVFIQFIGIGHSSFKYLQKLDDMTGRVRDNTGFSKMEDLNDASDKVLYTNVLEQFSMWLNNLQ